MKDTYKYNDFFPNKFHKSTAFPPPPPPYYFYGPISHTHTYIYMCVCVFTYVALDVYMHYTHIQLCLSIDTC